MRATVKRNLKRRHLYVLGYSGNDNDVWIAVQASEPKSISWLVKDSHDFAWRNLERFARTHDVNVANGDLRRLIKAFGQPSLAIKSPSAQQTLQRRHTLTAWGNNLSLVERYACLSELFFEIEDYQSVAKVSVEAFKCARGSERAGWFRIQAAEAFKIIGDFGKAERLAKEAIRLNKKIGDPFDIAGSYNIYGLIHTEKETPDLPRAVRALRRAAATAETIRLRNYPRHRREAITNFKARVQNNLGLALSHQGIMNEAIVCYRQSICIKRKLGDLLGIAITSGNISLAYNRLGRRRSAARWRSNALELMDRFDLQFQKAYLLRQTGVIACERGDFLEGRQFLTNALKIYLRLKQAHFGSKLTRKILRKYSL
jgi:tetratricopeptide (TPR) repeat protein